jgi:hypothetical protein
VLQQGAAQPLHPGMLFPRWVPRTTAPIAQRASDQGDSDVTMTNVAATPSGDMASGQLSSDQLSALSGWSFDPSCYADCPGPIAAAAVAAMAVTAVGIDVVLLLAGPDGLTAALSKFLSSFLTKALAAIALWGLLQAVDTFVAAVEFAIACLEQHGHDTSFQKEGLKKLRASQGWLRAEYEKLKKSVLEP